MKFNRHRARRHWPLKQVLLSGPKTLSTGHMKKKFSPHSIILVPQQSCQKSITSLFEKRGSLPHCNRVLCSPPCPLSRRTPSAPQKILIYMVIIVILDFVVGMEPQWEGIYYKQDINKVQKKSKSMIIFDTVTIYLHLFVYQIFSQEIITAQMIPVKHLLECHCCCYYYFSIP